MPKTTFITKYFLVFIFFWMTNSVAQNSNIDSLKQVITSKTVHDTIKIRSLSFLLVNISNTSKEYEFYNEYLKNIATQTVKNTKATPLVKEKGYDALALYHMNKGFQSMQSDYLVSIKHLNKSLDYFNSKYFVTDKYIAGRAYVLMSLGVMYNKIGNTNQSINNYFEALHIFEKGKDKGSISYAQQSIANLYKEQKKFKEALSYYLRAYTIYYKSGQLSFQDNIQKILLFINISSCYQELQQCQLSDSYLNKGLALALKLNDKDILSEIYFNIGQKEERCNHNNNSALLAYEKSLINSKLPENSANSLIAIGSVLMKQQQFQKAETYLIKGLNTAKKINHLEFQRKSSEKLYLLYKERGQFEKALKMSELFSVIKDSIKKEENDNALTKKQLQYEYEAKQSQLKLLQERKVNAITLVAERKNAAKNTMLIGLLSFVLLLLVGAYFFYRNYKQKQAISVFEKNELNQKLLLTQMNPHFIFNSIDNIQSLIYNKQDKEAVNYLTKFSKLTRQILENSNESYISLSEELTMIDNYLVIQQLLYNNKFDYTIDVDQAIETEMILLPPMLTQPFIENAIKHGLKNKTEKGTIAIHFYQQESNLFFEVTDNGSGFTTEEKPNANKSLAIKITKERLAVLSKKNNFEVCTENQLDSNSKVIGAKVYFEIPYIYEN